MITAAVVVLVAGFAMGIGYIWGSHDATENICARLTTSEAESLGLKEENVSRTSK